MKTKLVRIGSSRGVRIPKPLLHRAGWAEAATLAHEKGHDALLDGSVPTQFDEVEWEWR